MEPLTADDPRHAGPYRLVAALGEGGMGRVLLGIAPDGRLAAVKQVRAEFGRGSSFRDRFRQETELSGRVSGAYTAAVLDAGPDDDPPWLATVFIAGPTLREVIDLGGPLPAYAVRRLAAGLAAALADIHRAGLVHRDLKPGNVLLVEDGLRVIDFGIARALDGGPALTRTGAVIGSPAFMSPEQVDGKPLTLASDIFSLGSVLVSASTGRGPFTGDSAPQTLYNIVHTEPNLALAPPELHDLIEACLAKDPRRRPTPADVLDFASDGAASGWPQAVRSLIRQREHEVREVLALPIPPAPPRPPKPRRKRHRTAVVIAGAVVGLTAGLLLAVRPPGESAAVPVPVDLRTGLTREVLRQTDTCALLDGQTLATGDVLRLDDLYSDGTRNNLRGACEFTADDELTVRLNLNSEKSDLRDAKTVAQVDGLPLQVKQSGTTSCTALMRSPQFTNWGIAVSVAPKPGTDESTCALAQELFLKAAAGIRSGEHRYVYDTVRLLDKDPCTSLEPDRAAQIVGAAVTATPTLHACEWKPADDSGSMLSIEFRFIPVSSLYHTSPMPIGDFTTNPPESSGPECTVNLPYGALTSDKLEIARVTYRDEKTSDATCRKASDAATEVQTRFPSS